MKYPVVVLRKAYWIALGFVPLLLLPSFLSSNTDGGCWPGTSCWSQPLANEAAFVGFVARVLIWPLVAWNLGGRWLWCRLREKGAHEPRQA